MAYRNKTYIAGDWDHDHDAVEQIYKWKNGFKWSLDFCIRLLLEKEILI